MHVFMYVHVYILHGESQHTSRTVTSCIIYASIFCTSSQVHMSACRYALSPGPCKANTSYTHTYHDILHYTIVLHTIHMPVMYMHITHTYIR